MTDERTCARCAGSFEGTVLDKCPSCFKLVCTECRHNMRGRYFCSPRCAHYYFFEGEEEGDS